MTQMKTVQLLINLLAMGLSAGFPRTHQNPSDTPLCPPGTHLAPGASGKNIICLPCPPGQFQPTPNRSPSCLYHRECLNSGEIMLHEGSATRDAVCTCDEGERVYTAHPDTLQYTCALCSGGRVPKPVLNTRDRGDRGCCSPHQFAYRDSLGQLHCHDRVVSLQTTPTPSPTTNPSVLPEERVFHRQKEIPEAFWTYALGSGAVGFFVGLVVAIVIFVIYKMRKLTSSKKGDFLPVKTVVS